MIGHRADLIKIQWRTDTYSHLLSGVTGQRTGATTEKRQV